MVLARSKTSKGPVTFRSRTSSKATKTTLRVPTPGIVRSPSGTKWLQNGMEGAVHNSQYTVVLGEVYRWPPTPRRHGCRMLVLWTERTSNETADLSDFIVTT